MLLCAVCESVRVREWSVSVPQAPPLPPHNAQKNALDSAATLREALPLCVVDLAAAALARQRRRDNERRC